MTHVIRPFAMQEHRYLGCSDLLEGGEKYLVVVPAIRQKKRCINSFWKVVLQSEHVKMPFDMIPGQTDNLGEIAVIKSGLWR